MNARLNGGCQVPIAGFAILEDADQLYLRGLVGDPQGKLLLRSEARGSAADAEVLGKQVADDLLAQGADRILAELEDH